MHALCFIFTVHSWHRGAPQPPALPTHEICGLLVHTASIIYCIFDFLLLCYGLGVENVPLDMFLHRLNTELDLQRLFRLHVHSWTHCRHWHWAHIRGRYWSATIDDISLCPPICLVYYSRLPAYSCKCETRKNAGDCADKGYGQMLSSRPLHLLLFFWKETLWKNRRLFAILSVLGFFLPHWCHVTKGHLLLTSSNLFSLLHL
jgi:hypothetical protein